MVKIYDKVCVSSNNKNRLMKECVIEFLKHHSELKGFKFTHDFMMEKVIDYYLGINKGG